MRIYTSSINPEFPFLKSFDSTVSFQTTFKYWGIIGPIILFSRSFVQSIVEAVLSEYKGFISWWKLQGPYFLPLK